MDRRRCSPARLTNLDIDDLASSWSRIFRSSPPVSFKRELLIRLLAYGSQERAHGSLPRAVKKNLDALAGGSDDGLADALSPRATTTLRLGARLARSWNGVVHEVTVLERGFTYRGRQFRSLSEIAKVITGAHWSGPRFFGLKTSQSKLAKRAFS